MATAYIGIGSNLGNREKNCNEAVTLLTEKGLSIKRKSSTIETEPWGVKDQPPFINMAVSAETDLSPETLLKLLKAAETDMGRTESFRWGPRIIDLDLLFYSDLVLDKPDLTIPHPRLQDRYFVLKPLSEIAPDLMHPILKKSIRMLLKEMLDANRQ